MAHHLPGYSAVVALLFWGQDVVGSSPATPTICWIGEIGRRCGFKPRCHKGVRVQVPHPAPHAGLVEQVDTADSKSVASKRAGSSPVAGTTNTSSVSVARLDGNKDGSSALQQRTKQSVFLKTKFSARSFLNRVKR